MFQSFMKQSFESTQLQVILSIEEYDKKGEKRSFISFIAQPFYEGFG